MMPIRRFSAALAMLIMVLVTPGRAHAESPWPSVSVCTEVEGMGGTVQQSATLDSYVISGYVRACPGADDPQARWAVVRYGTGTPGVASRQMPYGEPGARGYHFLYRRYASPGTWAACIVNHVRPTEADPLLGTANRVACVGPDPAGPTPSTPGGPVLGTRLTPVPIDDPRFEGVLVVAETGTPHPVCTGCV